ncbi:MAG TPA: translocation/assembly module TamB domain-containing protein [Pseudomonadales bacterium]|nr:translocation/assembly module TamB domain-containing protein [Pseudomonadales bacterium]
MNARRLALFVLRLFLWGLSAAVLFAIALAASERGTALAARALSALVPGLALEHRAGNLLEAQFALVGWHDDSTTVSAHEVAWSLAPHCLLSDRLCFASLTLERLDIVLAPGQDDAAPFALEPLNAPLPVTITHGAIGELSIRRADSELLRLHEVRLGGRFIDSRITLESLAARMGEFSASLKAEIDLRAQLPLSVSGRIDWARRQQAELRLTGDLAHLNFDATGSGEYAIDAEGFAELLADAPRIELSASSRDTLHPLPAAPEFAALQDVVLRISGSSEELQAHFAARVSGSLSGAALLEGTATWTPERTHITRLELGGEAGSLVATGELRGAQWTARLDASDFCPLAWQPQFECRLSGESTLAGTLDGALATLDVRTVLHGSVNGRDARVEGSATRDRDGAWRLTGLRILNGTNRVQLDGRIGSTLALDATVELGNLGDTLAGAHGSGHARLRIGGTLRDPQVDGELSAQGLHWQDHAADRVNVQAHWPGLRNRDNRVRVSASGLVVAGTALGTLEASVEGSGSAHRIALAVHADSTRLETHCSGALAEGGDWRGNCDALGVNPHPSLGEWRADRAVSLAWDAGSTTARIGAFCLGHEQTTLCSTLPVLLGPERLEGIALRGRDIPLAILEPWLPVELQGDGMLGFDASASRVAGAPVRIEARVSGAAMTLGIPVGGDVLALELNGFTAGLQGTSRRAAIAWQLTLRGGGGVNGNLDADFANRVLDGTVSLQDLDLAQLAVPLPGMLDMAGTLAGTLRLHGALEAPQLSGALQLADARFVHERLSQPIEDVSVMIDFAGNDAHIDGRFRTGSGTATLGGSARFDDEGWSADLALRSSGLQIEPVRGSSATVAPELHLLLSPTQALLSGEVFLPSADIRIDELPDTAVSESPYAVVVGEEQAGTPFPWGLDVRVRLGEHVRLRGMGVDARLEGALDITRDANAGLLRGRGEIRIVDGRYTAYGQNLEVSEGRIRFRGALDRPDLALTAIRRIEDDNVEVGVRVRGDLREPVISTFSRPAMEETLAMHYLLTGRKPDSGDNLDLAVSTMLMQLGMAGANRITGSAASHLGIQDFQLAARQVEGGTEVHLSGYLSPDLYLRYGVSTFERINTFRLRYRLRGSFYIEAISGIENAIDFLYSFER